MTIDWKKYKFFNEDDFADPKVNGSGNFIDEDLLELLNELRITSGWDMIFHGKIGDCVDCCGEYKHINESYHLEVMGARAVHFHFDTDAHIREQFYEVVKGGFSGIGIYYDLIWNDKLLPIGFHVDNRPKRKMQIWKRNHGKYFYLLK